MPLKQPSPFPDRRSLMIAGALLPITMHGAGASELPQASRSTGAPSAQIIVFDVNETLLDFTVLEPVFLRIFGDPTMLRIWFNQVILYSEALTLSGEYADSGVVGSAVLNMLAEIKHREVKPSDLDEIKRLSSQMPTYKDTPAALQRLRSAGLRLVTLSNNPSHAVDAQLKAAGIRQYFDELHSIDDAVHRYKPALESYLSLAACLGVRPCDLWLVSCHAFDSLGAAAAGYRTALILRPENAPVTLGRAPDIVESDMDLLSSKLIRALQDALPSR